MKKVKLNISYDVFTLRQPFVSSVISQCAEAALREEGVTVPCEINVLITNDQGIQVINKASRDIDRPTDVLSFPMFELEPGTPPEGEEFLDPETELCPLGDMVISLEQCRAQAEDFGHSAEREICYLAVHSVLHLLGYDHMDEGPEKAQMRRHEDAIMAQLKLTR